MDRSRTVNTKFWVDPFIEELTPKEKLLFLYLLTNPKTNMLGIYEVSIRKISFETGLTQQEINKAFITFTEKNKCYFLDNYVVIPNFLKNQKMNPNMLKSAKKEFENVPNDIKNTLFGNSSKGFERVTKGFEMVRKIEKEIEKEIENEIVDKKTPFEIVLEDCENSEYNPQIKTSFKHFINVLRDRCKTLSKIDKQINIKTYYELVSDYGKEKLGLELEKADLWLEEKGGNKKDLNLFIRRWLKNNY